MPIDPKRAKSLFLTASDLASAGERAQFLDRECGDAADLRARVEALLAADAAPIAPADSPPNPPSNPSSADAVTLDDDAGPRPQSGSPLNRPSSPSSADAPGLILAEKYKLIERIGEGGMGSVWLAHQSKPVKRNVAVKLIKLGMDSRQVLARFEAERQALAMMDHPNIAKVLDGGLAPDGRPFFVMELVKGTPITEYCDAQKLTLKERMELFVPVCQAIQHAHQKGIIHRDIKPSNVMIAMYDDRPVPKVIDFGIAKATGQALSESTLNTGFGVIGTPQYMSPEQATLNNLDIDTRSDVYSLGVLLYELLTGEPPFSKQELEKKGLMEVLRVVREDEPPKPSTKLSTAAALPTLSANRGIEPRRLTQMLKSELDWIVLKALEKNRSRRYETANGLAADVQRYLSGEPVVAHPPSAGYRLRKFVRRNRVAVMAASAVAATLLIGVIAFAWQARLARDQRDLAVAAQKAEAEQREQADAARAEAQKQAAIAEAVANFQTEMLAAVDPNNLPRDPVTQEPLKDKVTVVQVMEAAVRELDGGSLKDQPLVEAEVRNTIGLTQRGLGRYADAEANFRKALAIWRATLPARDPTIAFGQNNLALVLLDLNKLAEAEPLFREVLETWRATYPAGDPEIATGLNNLATLLRTQNKFTEAEPLFREALDIWRATLPAGHTSVALILGNLAETLQAQDKFAEAEPLFREALATYRATLPAGHPTIGLSMTNLALLLQDQDKYAEAESLHREALKIDRAALPAGHPHIAKDLHNLAFLLLEQNKLVEAEPLALEALAIWRSALPAGHPEIATGLGNVAKILRAQKKLAEAEPLARESLEIRRKVLPAGHEDIALSLNILAVQLQDQGKFAEAEALFREALEIRRKARPSRHPDIAASLHNLAGLLQAQNKLAEAEPLLREVLELSRNELPAGHLDIADNLQDLAKLLKDQNKVTEAESLMREALKIYRAALPAGDPEIAQALNNLATLCWWQGKLDQSIPMFEESLKMDEKARGRQHASTQSAVANLGVNYKDADRLTEAIELLEEAYRASKQEPSLVWVGLHLLDAYSRSADPAKPQSVARVTALIKELLVDARATLPKDSPELAGQLARFGLTQLTLKAWHESEELLRESLAIREKTQPDAWTTFSTQSMLGGARLGQKKYADAQPLLLAGYEGMKQREKTIPPQGQVRLIEAIDRLIDLFTATNKPGEVRKWQAERAKYPDAASPK